MSPKVSVIVAVYNIEKYITKCLDSLRSQTLKEIEFIIVDDGSTDSCPGICDEYQNVDNRFRVIHKPNGGLWSARQVGFENAKGEYILACDGDDWLESSMCEELYLKASKENLDIAICGYFSEYSDGKVVPYFMPLLIKKPSEILNDVLNGKYPPMVWNKLIRKKFLIDNSISWYPGINMGEDIFLFIRILRCNPTIEAIEKPLYHYLRRFGENSYTNSITISTYKQMEFYRLWIEENLDKKIFGKGIFNMWINLAFSGLRTKGMNSSIYKDTLSHIRFIDFIKYHRLNAKYLLVFLSKLFGYKFGRTVINSLYRTFYH